MSCTVRVHRAPEASLARLWNISNTLPLLPFSLLKLSNTYSSFMLSLLTFSLFLKSSATSMKWLNISYVFLSFSSNSARLLFSSSPYSTCFFSSHKNSTSKTSTSLISFSIVWYCFPSRLIEALYKLESIPTRGYRNYCRFSDRVISFAVNLLM